MNSLNPETVTKVIFLIIICSIASLVEVSANVFDPLVKGEAYFIKAIEQSKKTEFGKNKIIAILDTGINDNNYELKGQVIAEYDFTTDSTVAIDHNGHGTKMASIIAAKNNGRGITGIAYNAKLIDVKVVDGSGSITTENIIKGIHFAVKKGAEIINMSFASGSYSAELEQVISKYFKSGVLFVAAAGNDGESAVVYPAGYLNVISVSSYKGNTKEVARYANYGAEVDKYVSDGIWTFDGSDFLREYGTSESSAVVSSIIKKGSEHTGKKIKTVNKTYLAGLNASEFEEHPLFETNEEGSFLNIASNYYYHTEMLKRLLLKIKQLKYDELDSYSQNPGVSLVALDRLVPSPYTQV